MNIQISNSPKPEKSLAELISLSALGNQEAFKFLYEATAPKLLAVVLRILKNKRLAEEVLQDGFVRIWHHAINYQATSSAPMTWMTVIMRNAALDVVRRKSSEDTLDEDKDFDMFASDQLSPAENFQLSSSANAVENCLKQLPSTQRQTIVLAFYHGLTHSELAQHLSQPIGTIKSWTRRGMERIKGCLESI